MLALVSEHLYKAHLIFLDKILILVESLCCPVVDCKHFVVAAVDDSVAADDSCVVDSEIDKHLVMICIYNHRKELVISLPCLNSGNMKYLQLFLE